MLRTFKLNILSADREIFKGDAVYLLVPGEAGYLGVLANHAALTASLRPGEIVVKNEKGEAIKFISAKKGVLEVNHNTATILLDECSAGEKTPGPVVKN